MISSCIYLDTTVERQIRCDAWAYTYSFGTENDWKQEKLLFCNNNFGLEPITNDACLYIHCWQVVKTIAHDKKLSLADMILRLEMQYFWTQAQMRESTITSLSIHSTWKKNIKR